MKVKQNCEIKTICLSQEVYIKNLLKQHEMKNCHTVSTSMQEELQITNTAVNDDKFVNKYQSVVGSLQFLATYTRLDISFAVGFLARWNHAPTKQCWEAVKYTMRYLKGILSYGVLFDGSQGFRLVGYSDSDWGADLQDRKSTTGSLIKIAGGPIYWRSTKQTGVSLSTTEAEYIAASETACKIISVRGIFQELEIINPEFTFPLFVDNNGAI